MKNRALTKLLKATVAVLALAFIIVAFSTVAGATDAVVEEGTKVINMEYYRTYSFYPDGYKVDNGEITPFVGTYILTGHPCEDVVFKSYDEPATYNVIFHNLDAMATDWYGMLGVDCDVTLNVTVYGANNVFGYNHPGISIGPKNEGASPIVNITMTENSSIRFGAQYHTAETCIAEGITVNLINGSSSIDMSNEGWRKNRQIEFTKGKDYAHQMKYVYVDDKTCSYVCNDCDMLGATNGQHYMDCTPYGIEHPDYTAKHLTECYNCLADFGAADHEKRYQTSESTHIERCYDCGYGGEETQHVTDISGCTVCGMLYRYLYEADGEATYFFTSGALAEALSQKGGRVTVLQDMQEMRGFLLNVSSDLVVDLNGKTMDGIYFDVEPNVTLSIVDTSDEKSGLWKFTSANASYVSGTMSLDGISVDTVIIIVNDDGVLTVKDVASSTELFVRVSKASAEFKGLDVGDTFELNVDAYWGDFEISLEDVRIEHFILSTNYGQDISMNMLLPEGYAFSGPDGLIDGGGVEIYDVTAIVEHGEHNNDRLQVSSSEHWYSCTCGYSDNPVKELHNKGADGLCDACGEKIVATVTYGDTILYYSDLADALIDTINYEKSTVTLLCDYYQPVYKELDIKKDVVLDLNGYEYMTNGRLRVWKSLTIVDSGEGKTGKLYAGSDISYIIEFYSGSTVTINDGEFFGLIYGAIYNDGTATITINGGRFIGEEKFRLGSGTTIIVNGGVFESAKTVFSYIWSSKVVYRINGGVFINSTVFYVEQDYIPSLEEMMGKDGDCDLWFISSTGKPLTVEELCSFYEGEIFVYHRDAQQPAANHVAHGLYCKSCGETSEYIEHTVTYVPLDDGESHLAICIYCEWEFETGEHTGGEATCTDKAACEYCSAPYGEEPRGHAYDNDCDDLCNVCKTARAVADHVYDNACDGECNVCKGTREVPDHVYDNACDGECNVCKATRAIGEHSYGDDGKCISCGAERSNADKGKMGAAAIVFIIVGSVGLVGGSVAAVFAIKKKKIR